jgi:hypothetical protein
MFVFSMLSELGYIYILLVVGAIAILTCVWFMHRRKAKLRRDIKTNQIEKWRSPKQDRRKLSHVMHDLVKPLQDLTTLFGERFQTSVKKIQAARDGDEPMLQQQWCRLNSPSQLHRETTKGTPTSLHWAARSWDVDGIFDGLIIPTEIAQASLHFSYTQDHDTAFASILLQKQSGVDIYSDMDDASEPSLVKNLGLVKAPAGFKDRYQSADRAFGLHRALLSAMYQMSNKSHVFMDRSPQQVARAMNFYADAIGGSKLPSLSREELCKGLKVLGAIDKAEDELSDGSVKDVESIHEKFSVGSLYDAYDNDYYDGGTFEYTRPTRVDSQISGGGGDLPADMSQAPPTYSNQNPNPLSNPQWNPFESFLRTRSSDTGGDDSDHNNMHYDTGGDDHTDIDMQYAISTSNSFENRNDDTRGNEHWIGIISTSNSFENRNDDTRGNEHWMGINETLSGSAGDVDHADNDSDISAFGFGSIYSRDSRRSLQSTESSYTHMLLHAADDDHAGRHTDGDMEGGVDNPFYKR